ncbi:MAG: hypothetical protein N3G20_06185, partial [Verrucomicrobiae bacterium]|nr:hypothetical protein [Verrucomicrobiae bacterium]
MRSTSSKANRFGAQVDFSNPGCQPRCLSIIPLPALRVASFALILGFLHSRTGVTEDVVFKVARTPVNQTNLVVNGSFELAIDGKVQHWSSAPAGMTFAPRQGRASSAAIVCESKDGHGWFGASQTIVANQQTPRPLLVRGWSKAENVSGSADSDYSLYVDLVYEDGEPLWGQTGNFRCGTHDWEKREFLIWPEKPVRSFTIHCLFRRHAGKVWFDDVSVEELSSPVGTVLFQGVPVEIPAHGQVPDISTVAARIFSPDQRGGFEHWVGSTGGGFAARDCAADTDFLGFEGNTCSSLGLAVEASCSFRENCVFIDGRLRDTRMSDRAITLVFAFPLDSSGLRWGDDVRIARPVQGQSEFANTATVKCGATGTISLYPIAAVWNDKLGLAVGIDMAKPAVYRVGYHAGLRRMFIAYDFGMVPDAM